MTVKEKLINNKYKTQRAWINDKQIFSAANFSAFYGKIPCTSTELLEFRFNSFLG